ncbi:hypothetical protein GOA81_18060 [Sinorhizobium meliloti]|nr:hypothetical protein [Sinorhizobium meliloti]MDW9798898.1 hypothetical protein [Sinorhizobium meliloti]
MSDEKPAVPKHNVVIRSGRKLLVGGVEMEVIDRTDGVRFVDLITEATHVNGIAYISMGSAIHEFNNDTVLELSTRIRMSLGTAQTLHGMLGNIISDALKSPVDKDKAN